jgi:hypothetical protein
VSSCCCRDRLRDEAVLEAVSVVLVVDEPESATVAASHGMVGHVERSGFSKMISSPARPHLS